VFQSTAQRIATLANFLMIHKSSRLLCCSKQRWIASIGIITYPKFGGKADILLSKKIKELLNVMMKK
jgi:hypothetical protein